MALEESGEQINHQKEISETKFNILINERKNTKNVQDKNKSDKEANRVPENSSPLKNIVYNNSS